MDSQLFHSSQLSQSTSSSHLKEYREHLSQNEISQAKNSNSQENNINNSANTIKINLNQISENNISSNNAPNNINISSKIYQNEKSKSLNNYKIICKNCCNFPFISFNKEEYLNVLCDCKNISYMDYDFFIKNYIVKDTFGNLENKNNKTKILIENYCSCEIHCKPYLYFCKSCSESQNKICGLNLCEDCIKEKSLHSKHIIFYYDNNMNNNILNVVKFVKNHNNKINSEKFVNFLLILKLILICAKKYFCLNIFKTIESTSNFININLSEINHNNNNNKNEIIMKKKQEQLINIKGKKELIFYLQKPEYHKEIKSIDLSKDNFYDISILSNTELTNLELLSLPNNNIVNIDPLKSIKAPNLKRLNLSTNFIPDKYIYVLKDMNFPKVNFINLARNYFHDYNIFACFEKKYELETLFLGTNKFEKSDINNNTIIKYELPNIKKIGLTRGVFSDITIKLISNFNFVNLLELYLSGNNLSSLDFVENLNCKNLIIFWAFSNNFSEFSPLVKFSNLEQINLSNNIINDISLLFDFINKMKHLSLFDLTNNKIEKNGKYSEIINKINQLKGPEGRDIKILI